MNQEETQPKQKKPLAFEFEATSRTTGKSASRAARVNRQVPSVVYGPKLENTNVFLNETLVKKFSTPKFESTIFTLKSDVTGLDNVRVLIKDVQFDPVTVRPVHVDLYALDMTQKVKVNVVINFEGTPIGVKEEGGLLQTILTELEVECLPTNIPDNITVDISGVKAGESLHVSAITLPKDVKAVTAETRTLVTVNVGKAEPAADEAAVATDAQAPEKTEEKA